MKEVKSYIITFIITAIILIITLITSCMFPSTLIKSNVMESCEILRSETWKRKIGNRYADNLTEELMVNIAYSIDNNNPFYSSIVARRNYLPGITTNVYPDSLQDLDMATNYDGEYGTSDLEEMLKEKDIDSYEYTRYWHGYLSIIRPLLLVFNIKGIRYLFSFIIIVSTIIMLILLYKKLNIKIMIIYLIALLGVDVTIMGISLQGAFCFLIAIIFNIILLVQKEINIKKIMNIFMVVRNSNMLF